MYLIYWIYLLLVFLVRSGTSYKLVGMVTGIGVTLSRRMQGQYTADATMAFYESRYMQIWNWTKIRLWNTDDRSMQIQRSQLLYFHAVIDCVLY